MAINFFVLIIIYTIQISSNLKFIFFQTSILLHVSSWALHVDLLEMFSASVLMLFCWFFCKKPFLVSVLYFIQGVHFDVHQEFIRTSTGDELVRSVKVVPHGGMFHREMVDIVDKITGEKSQEEEILFSKTFKTLTEEIVEEVDADGRKVYVTRKISQVPETTNEHIVKARSQPAESMFKSLRPSKERYTLLDREEL